MHKFKIIIDKVIKCRLYDYFIFFKDIVTKGNKKHFKKNSTDKIFVNQRYKYSKYKENEKNKEKENKNTEEYKQALSQKEADYENILQNYNSLVTELQKIINSNEDNNTNDKTTLKDILKTHKLKNKTKKFDIISPEPKDKFDLINEGKDDKNKKLETINDNNQSILNHFTSNLKVINNEQILIANNGDKKMMEQGDKKTEKTEELNKIEPNNNLNNKNNNISNYGSKSKNSTRTNFRNNNNPKSQTGGLAKFNPKKNNNIKLNKNKGDNKPKNNLN
jgi:hypothetical protein